MTSIDTQAKLLIPAGLAFAASIAKRPNINLYVPDKRHPSMAVPEMCLLACWRFRSSYCHFVRIINKKLLKFLEICKPFANHSNQNY